MPNGILSDMDFEKHLNDMGDNQIELLKFVARQQYSMSKLCPIHTKDIKDLKCQNKKTFGIVGGIGGVIGTAVGAAITTIWEKIKSG